MSCEEICIDCDTGYLPSGYNFIKQAPPFNEGLSGCCVPCKGWTGSDGSTEPRIFGLQYVSIDDGYGGYVESCSGKSGFYYPWDQAGSTPTIPTNRATSPVSCCSLNGPHTANYGPPPTSYAYDCAGTQRIVQCGGGGSFYCNTTASICTSPTTYGCGGTYVPCTAVPCSCCSTYCYAYSACCDGWTSPTYNCYCKTSSFQSSCNPFVWEGSPGLCQFTGRLYNNDGLASVDEGAGEIFFDICRKKWVLHSLYTGINNQWHTGQYFYGECSYCSGLEQCTQTGSYWYGSFKPDSGPGEAFICMSSAQCDFPSISKAACKTAHEINLKPC